jgi:hypothetical protein
VLQSEASELLKAFAESCNIPVTTTIQGLGCFDELSPLSLHFLGMHGSAYANYAMQQADLIVALGARFDDRVTGNLNSFAPVSERGWGVVVSGVVVLLCWVLLCWVLLGWVLLGWILLGLGVVGLGTAVWVLLCYV